MVKLKFHVEHKKYTHDRPVIAGRILLCRFCKARRLCT